MARQTQFKRTQKFKTVRKNGKRTSSMRGNTYSPYSSIRGTNPQNSVTFKGKGFPDRITTNLVYCDSIILDPSAGTPMPFKTYRLSSVFDPDESLGGGQPTYFDQLALVYKRYIVNGAKITATFSKSTTITANEGPYMCGITCADVAGLPSTSAGPLISSPNTSFKFVSQEDGSQQVVATYSLKNTFPDLSSSAQARVNANPAVEWMANIFAGPQGINIETPINVIITIEYNVTFSDVARIVDA